MQSLDQLLQIPHMCSDFISYPILNNYNEKYPNGTLFESDRKTVVCKTVNTKTIHFSNLDTLHSDNSKCG